MTFEFYELNILWSLQEIILIDDKVDGLNARITHIWAFLN
jgi:hypothetical protein